MDGWQAVQNWAIFGVAVGGLAWYYYPKGHVTEKLQEKVKASEQPAPPKRPKQRHANRSEKLDTKSATPVSVPTTRTDVSKDTNDDNALNFAEQMMKARKGTTLKSADKSDSRVKTVKQGNALRAQAVSSAPAPSSAELADDVAPSVPSSNVSGVDDMLEPVASGPTSLRIAPAQQPVKERAPKQAKKEVVETKKQRQNRQKIEAKKQQREDEERERKALEEKQRRAAREARGEPAKNGIPVSQPPASSAWSSSNGTAKSVAGTAPAASPAPLLDTFDVESTGSSNAGVSTAATSTSEAHQTQWVEDLPSEEEQIAMFQAQDNGWNEVKSTKKQKKKVAADDTNGASTPVPPTIIASKPVAPVIKMQSNGKPIGFQALNDELEQSADVDPNDASNWAA